MSLLDAFPTGIEKKVPDINKEIEELNQFPEIEEINEEHFSVKMAKRKIPFLTEFLNRLNSVGSAFVRAERTFSNTTKPLAHAAQGFQYIGVALAVVDFFEVPLLYLSAGMTGAKVPFSLKNNAKWIYSAAVLALVILSIVLPAVALPIWAALSFMAIGEVTVTLGYMWYQRRSLKKQIKHLEDQLTEINQQLEENVQEINKLIVAINSNPDNLTDENINTIKNKLDSYEQNKQKKNAFSNELRLHQRELSELTPSAFIDKGMGVIFSSLSLIGLLVFVISPPIGAIFLASVGGLVVIYAIARIARDGLWPMIKSGIQKNKEQELSMDQGEVNTLKTAKPLFQFSEEIVKESQILAENKRAPEKQVQHTQTSEEPKPVKLEVPETPKTPETPDEGSPGPSEPRNH